MGALLLRFLSARKMKSTFDEQLSYDNEDTVRSLFEKKFWELSRERVMNQKLDRKIYLKYRSLFNDPHVPATRTGFSFEHGDGWYDLVNTLCGCIHQHVEYQQKTDPKFYVTVVQVKEKFGGLRFYYGGGDAVVEGMVRLAEHLSEKTCEQCGRVKDVTQAGRAWIVTRCPICLLEQHL